MWGYQVDNVHVGAYKMLSGLARARNADGDVEIPLVEGED